VGSDSGSGSGCGYRAPSATAAADPTAPVASCATATTGPRALDAQRLVEREASRPAVDDREDRRDDGQVVLVAALGRPQALGTVDLADGRRHDAGQDRAGDRGEQTGGQQCPAGGLGYPGGGGVVPARTQAEAVEHRAGPVASGAAEPPLEPLEAVAHEQAAEDDAKHCDAESQTARLPRDRPAVFVFLRHRLPELVDQQRHGAILVRERKWGIANATTARPCSTIHRRLYERVAPDPA
jgi:hypothetical protein